MNNDSAIFLLTADKDREAIIKSYINSQYEIYVVNKANLMAELYKENPRVLIMDIDSHTKHTIDIIQSILYIEYFPIIYVYSNKELIPDTIKSEIVIPIQKLDETIMLLIKQSKIFKNKYDEVMESYNAIDLLNNKIKPLLKKCVGNGYDNRDLVIKELIDSVYAENMFLKNKPSLVWAIYEKRDEYSAIMFKLDKKYEKVAIIDFNKEDRFGFDVYAPNGFSKNFNVNELSDIGSNEKLFPRAIKERINEISNFGGFAVGNLIFIGMEYKFAVTNYDISIIRALTINYDLFGTVKSQVNELEEAFEYTTSALARAAEVNDDLTGKHIKRVNSFAKRIAEELGMSSEFIRKIYNAAQMHDVGKIYIDKAILTKKGKLTDEEFEHIKSHTVYGEKIIGESEYLRMSSEIARNHHERYDGTGYPNGKKGEDIPMSSRIVFLADIYDALRSERPYKPGFSHEKSYEIITKGDGRVEPQHFDPAVLETFKKIHDDFKKIYEQLKD